jgi:hypothetical protein
MYRSSPCWCVYRVLAATVLAPLDATNEAERHLRGSNIEEHAYPGVQHEVLNEISKHEVLDDVLNLLRRALEFDPSPRAQSRAATQ